MIWLIGENIGRTFNNNAFYFWKYAVNKWNDSKKYKPYYVVCKTLESQEMYNTLTKIEKSFIVWFDTAKHKELYKKSYFNIISLSMLDVVPTKYKKGKHKTNVKRIIHLKHGINFLKKGEMRSTIYNNNLTRLYMYNENLLEAKLEELEPYQIIHNPYMMPRHQYLLENKKETNNEIVWFLTWRDYKFQDAKDFKKYIEYIITSSELRDVLKSKKLKLKLIVHHLFDITIDEFEDEIITLIYQNDIDFTEEILNSKMLITDYSSVVFEYALLNKPIIFFAPDKELYNENRGFYIEYTNENLKAKIATTLDELVEAIKEGGSKKTVIHEFMENKDKEVIKQGASSKFILEDLEKLIENRYTFIVYNIFGGGGTISSTLTLAKQIIENGGIVDIISLRKTVPNKIYMPSLNVKTIVNVQKSKSKKAKYKHRLYRIGPNLKSLKHDPIFVKNRKYFGTIASYKLIQTIKNITTGNLISTRESFHTLLNENTHLSSNDKIFIFHLGIHMLKEEKKLVKYMNENLEKNGKAIMVSKLSYNAIDTLLKLKNKYILYNAYKPTNLINKYEYKKSNKINICYIGRINIEKRIDLLPDIINRLPEEKFYFHIFGEGNYTEQLKCDLKKTEKNNFHMYGLVPNPEMAYNIADISLVLSDYESFGMVYIESLYNDVPILTKPILAAKEVLEGLENVFYEDNDDLVKKLNDELFLKDMQKSLEHNKNIIERKFNVDKLYETFINIVKDDVQNK